jgi:hypothetical protein
VAAGYSCRLEADTVATVVVMAAVMAAVVGNTAGQDPAIRDADF